MFTSDTMHKSKSYFIWTSLSKLEGSGKIMFSKEWSLWMLKSNRKLTANTLDNKTHVLVHDKLGASC